MSIKNPIHGSLKECDISYQPAVEHEELTPIALPTSRPASPQISFLVEESDIPTLSVDIKEKVLMLYLYISGKNNSADFRRVYFEFSKNDVVNKEYDSNVGAANFYTMNRWMFDVKVGDEIKVRLWGETADLDWYYHARAYVYTRINPYKKGMLEVAQFGDHLGYPDLSGGVNPIVATTSSGYGRHFSLGTASIFSHLEKNYSPWKGSDERGWCQVQTGDASVHDDLTWYTSTTQSPRYRRENVITKLTFRGIRHRF